MCAFAEPSDGLEPSTPSLPCATERLGCHRLPIGLFGPFSVLPYLRPVATGCAPLAPQTLHGFPEFGGLLVDGLRAVAGEQPHGRVAVAQDEFLQRVEGALGQLVEAADQFGAVLGELRFAVGQ